MRSRRPNESTDFTPWLAQEGNIRALSAALGIELEVEDTEVAVGPYSADILARDSGTGQYVVIENQLAKTNHDHLGKALTYGAVLGASAIIWIAPEFTDEHRRALDWLNDNTTDDVEFYGVQVELWRIDKSSPAIRFNILSRPADTFRKALIFKRDGKSSAIKDLQLEWWTQYANRLKESGVVTSPRSPRPRNWYNAPLGRTGVHLSNFALHRTVPCAACR